MNPLQIECPHCKKPFELSEVLTSQVRDGVKGELKGEIESREASLKAEQKKLAVAQESLEEEVEAGLKKRSAELQAKAEKKLADQYTEQLTAQQDQMAEQALAIKTFRTQELALREEKRKLEASKEELELENARKLDAERNKIREEASKKVAEEHRLKDAEKDRKLNEALGAVEDMKRKMEQGSMESQGEVLEDLLEEKLGHMFPHDELRPVPKGVKGADVLQVVRSPQGEECGTIVWEAKNTKTWSNQWIPKLKEDMIEVRGNIAVLVSRALPEGVERFGQVDGVWVCDDVSALALVVALREQLMVVQRERITSVGRHEKMEVLYDYLMGNEFKQKIEGIVDAFIAMQQQIAVERRAMEKQWKSREKMIERVIKNTVGMHGDIQGIAGGQLPSIPALELDSGPEDADSLL